jgi:amino-acid N-acetyltransferase
VLDSQTAFPKILSRREAALIFLPRWGLRRNFWHRTSAETPGLEVPRLNIRPARVGDVPAIYELIRTFADRKLMIRRSMGELYESIREFFVAVDEDKRIVGCVALHVFWEDLAELKCLAVAEDVHGQGVGRRLVDACWNSAGELEINSVFALTYAVDFFERCGYHQIDKAELPHKIWNECVRCPLFPSCQEVALIRSHDPERLGTGLSQELEVLQA